MAGNSERELIRQAVLSRAPVEILGSIVNPLMLVPCALLLDVIGVRGWPWAFAPVALLLAYLRKGALCALARSSVDEIAIKGERIRTPIRGLVNGFVVLVSAGSAYALLRTYLEH